MMADDDIDGVPLVSAADEDIDGVPLGGDDDIDGVPLAADDDDDIDGVPLDGMPLAIAEPQVSTRGSLPPNETETTQPHHAGAKLRLVCCRPARHQSWNLSPESSIAENGFLNCGPKPKMLNRNCRQPAQHPSLRR